MVIGGFIEFDFQTEIAYNKSNIKKLITVFVRGGVATAS